MKPNINKIIGNISRKNDAFLLEYKIESPLFMRNCEYKLLDFYAINLLRS